jgi:thiamine biosynthesis lipoprotein
MLWGNVLAIALLVLLWLVPTRATDAATAFVHKKKYAMGTVFEIVAYDSSPGHAAAAIDQAFKEIVRLDELLSNYNPDSELSRLNRTAHFQPQAVSADLYRITEESVEYSRISGGKFDITVAPLVDLWKEALRSGTAPSIEQQLEARQCIGYEKIKLLYPSQIQFRSSCLRIDVGGIGKGYAIDRAADILRSRGISRALLDAGGSTIYAMGAPRGQPGWLVRLRDPSQRVDPRVMLSENSLSTSEQTPPSLLQNNSAGHIIDPATGLPVDSPYAVSVIATTATASDALSTTLLLVGPSAGKKIVEKIPGSAALWVAPTGETATASCGTEIIVHHDLGSSRRSQREFAGDGRR